MRIHVWKTDKGWMWDDAEDHGGYDRNIPCGPFPQRQNAIDDAAKCGNVTIEEVIEGEPLRYSEGKKDVDKYQTITVEKKEIVILTEPLTTEEVKGMLDDDGYITVNICVPLFYVVECGDTDGLNELCDNRIMSDSNFLSDLTFKVVGSVCDEAESEGEVIIRVCAKPEGSAFEEDADETYRYDTLEECEASGDHNQSCDDNGFCNACGHQSDEE